MPLRYRRNNTTYNVYYYPSVGDLNGPGVSSNHRLVISKDGDPKYIGLSSNLNHETASHLRVRIGGTTYAVLRYSKMVTGEIDG